MFIKELNMYLDIFRKQFESFQKDIGNVKEKRNLVKFKQNLFDGISYYKELFTEKKKEVVEELDGLLKKYPELNTEL